MTLAHKVRGSALRLCRTALSYVQVHADLLTKHQPAGCLNTDSHTAHRVAERISAVISFAVHKWEQTLIPRARRCVTRVSPRLCAQTAWQSRSRSQSNGPSAAVGVFCTLGRVEANLNLGRVHTALDRCDATETPSGLGRCAGIRRVLARSVPGRQRRPFVRSCRSGFQIFRGRRVRVCSKWVPGGC